MDHLWRHSKALALANRPTLSIDASALALCRYIIDLSPVLSVYARPACYLETFG